MNAIHPSYKEEITTIDNIQTLLWNLINTEQIEEYDRQWHIEWDYNDDFIYIFDKKEDKIYVIKDLDLANFTEIENKFNFDDFEIFCYSKTNTWCTYNSYKPEWESYILNIKARIDNIMDLKN